MRIIKFRVWDKDIKIMEENPKFCDGCDDNNCCICINSEFENTNKVFMQYTGLKDKNGVEIYEGDIVKGINEFFGQMKGIVEFNEYMFILEEKDKERGSSLSSLNNNDLEVIGNIYEDNEVKTN